MHPPAAAGKRPTPPGGGGDAAAPGKVPKRTEYTFVAGAAQAAAGSQDDELPIPEGPLPEVSVTMPVWNALPWLPDTIGDILAQEGVRLEFIAVDDGSDDGSYQWMREAERLQHVVEPDTTGGGGGEGGGQLEGQPSARWEGYEKEKYTPPTVEHVLRRRRPGNLLRVFTVNRGGQGAALNLGLSKARAPYVGGMESDDLCPPDRFLQLKRFLDGRPDLQCVTSGVKLVGWEREGMARYIGWQNSLLTCEQMAAARFVEIPALHQTGLFRREALAAFGYRDLVGQWPIDMDLWNRWFEKGYRAAKVNSALYLWRQYPTQSTRTHTRCSIDHLRRCKVHFLTREGGPAHGRGIQLWGCGNTVESWAEDLRGAGAQVEVVVWKPGQPLPKGGEVERGLNGVRLFTFGMEKARNRVRASFGKKALREGDGDFFVN